MRTHAFAAAAVAALLVSVAAPAFADDEADGGTTVAYSHKRQFGLNADMGTGYRVLFPYNKEYCGQDGKSVCTGRSPTFLDIGLSFGLSRAIELIGELRLGLETDFVDPAFASAKAPRQLAIAPGVRVFVDDQGSLKFFSTLQIALDFTPWDKAVANLKTGTDIGIRNSNGLLLDFHKTFGVYVQFGETIGFNRWLRFELDGGAGVQVRFP